MRQLSLHQMLDGLNTKLYIVLAKLEKLDKQGIKIMAVLDALTAEVNALVAKVKDAVDELTLLASNQADPTVAAHAATLQAQVHDATASLAAAVDAAKASPPPAA